MARINTQQRNNGENKDFIVLPSDVYRMKVIKATYEENRFADPLNDGSKPMQITLSWEVTQLTEEQEEAAGEAGEDWGKATVPQYLNPFYGDVRKGGPSKFKAFIDGLKEQGYLQNFDPSDFETDDFLNIEQRISIERYIKTMGDNAGKWGNKVVSVLPLRKAKANGVKKEKAALVPAGMPEEDLPDPFM